MGAEEMWGWRSDEVEGQCFLNLDIGLPVEQLRSASRAVLEDETAFRQENSGAINHRGRTINCQITCTPLSQGTQTIDGAILMMEEQ
jgi:two-component system CheB/CheR fusion protein